MNSTKKSIKVGDLDSTGLLRLFVFPEIGLESEFDLDFRREVFLDHLNVLHFVDHVIKMEENLTLLFTVSDKPEQFLSVEERDLAFHVELLSSLF